MVLIYNNFIISICDNENEKNNEVNPSIDYYNFKELKSVINFEENVNSNEEFNSISNSINESKYQFLLDNVSNNESFKNNNNFDENIFNNITNYKNLQFL